MLRNRLILGAHRLLWLREQAKLPVVKNRAAKRIAWLDGIAAIGKADNADGFLVLQKKREHNLLIAVHDLKQGRRAQLIGDRKDCGLLLLRRI